METFVENALEHAIIHMYTAHTCLGSTHMIMHYSFHYFLSPVATVD